MKKTLSAVCLAACLFASGWAQTAPVAGIPSEGKLAQDFVPAGWEIMRQVNGDLNGDGLEDLALVIRGTDASLHKASDMMVGESRVKTVDGRATLSVILDQNPRALLVLLKNASGYQLVAQNQSVLPTPSFPNGETLAGMEIKDSCLNFGLVFMDRRHGEVYAKVAYQFQWADDQLVLAEAVRVQNDRHVKDTQLQRQYDFRSKSLTVRTNQFSSGKLISENKSTLEIAAPKFDEMTADWQASE